MRSTTTPALLGIAALLLGGCGSSAAEPEPAPTAEPPAPATATSSAENRGDWDLVVADVRAARHGSDDRVVLELDGTGTPGWTSHYVDEAVMEGSGERAPVDGDQILQVVASGTTYPADVEESLGMRHVTPQGTEAVVDVYLVGTFEGYTQLFVGLDGERVPFEVSTLTDPTRLVIDLRP